MATDPRVTAYIAKAPAAARKGLRQVRAAIRAAAPGITERISYRMPTFDYDGKYLLYVAAHRDHIGIYPVTDGLAKKCGKSIERYRHGRGTLRFAFDKPLPLALVTKVAKLRVQERVAARRRR